MEIFTQNKLKIEHFSCVVILFDGCKKFEVDFVLFKKKLIFFFHFYNFHHFSIA